MKKRVSKSQASVELLLEKEIETLVNDALGQSSADVSCTFIGQSDLAILIENIKTPLEEFLQLHGHSKILRRYRRGLEIAISRRVQKLVEETIEQPTRQVSMRRQTETRWMGIFSFL